MPLVHHPWRELRSLNQWTLHWGTLPSIMGEVDFGTRRITLASDLLQAERRCTIAHEIEHIRRGPVPDDDRLAAREEAAVDLAVARQLIDIRDLGEALAWSQDLTEVADELWVDVPTLKTRLAHLHPAERAYLIRRLEHHGTDHQTDTRRCAEQGLACAECDQRAVCPTAGAVGAPCDR